jgi:hypothetical protein
LAATLAGLTDEMSEKLVKSVKNWVLFQIKDDDCVFGDESDGQVSLKRYLKAKTLYYLLLNGYPMKQKTETLFYFRKTTPLLKN